MVHSSFINKLILQSLEWTRAENKPFSLLRIKIHKVIQILCATLGTNCNFNNINLKNLIDEYIHDVKPLETVLKVKQLLLNVYLLKLFVSF